MGSGRRKDLTCAVAKHIGSATRISTTLTVRTASRSREHHCLSLLFRVVLNFAVARSCRDPKPRKTCKKTPWWKSVMSRGRYNPSKKQQVKAKNKFCENGDCYCSNPFPRKPAFTFLLQCFLPLLYHVASFLIFPLPLSTSSCLLFFVTLVPFSLFSILHSVFCMGVPFFLIFLSSLVACVLSFFHFYLTHFSILALCFPFSFFLFTFAYCCQLSDSFGPPQMCARKRMRTCREKKVEKEQAHDEKGMGER